MSHGHPPQDGPSGSRPPYAPRGQSQHYSLPPGISGPPGYGQEPPVTQISPSRHHSRRSPRGVGFHLLAIGLPALLLGGGLGAMTVIAAQVVAGSPAPATATASASSSAAEATITVTGTMEVEASSPGTVGRSCETDGGYDDIGVGTQVVISDASSTTLAVGQLGMGYYGTASKCLFPFSVEVKGGQDFYGVEVGHRGRLQYSAADVAEPMSLSLGD